MNTAWNQTSNETPVFKNQTRQAIVPNRHGATHWVSDKHIKIMAITFLLAVLIALVAIMIPRTARAADSATSVAIENEPSSITDAGRKSLNDNSEQPMRISDSREPSVVPNLQLEKFVGTWFEIATIPQIFERNCVATRATYTALPNGEIDVFNQCNNKTFDGQERSIHGKAWTPVAAIPAKLRVQFFWPLSAAYWVIALDENSNWAITGSPDRKNLWILSRTKTMDAATYQILLKLAEDQGFNTASLKLTPQP